MTSKFVYDEYWVNQKIEEIIEQKRKLQEIKEHIFVLKINSQFCEEIKHIEKDIGELIYSFDKIKDSLQKFKENINYLTMKSELDVEAMSIHVTKLFS